MEENAVYKNDGCIISEADDTFVALVYLCAGIGEATRVRPRPIADAHLLLLECSSRLRRLSVSVKCGVY